MTVTETKSINVIKCEKRIYLTAMTSDCKHKFCFNEVDWPTLKQWVLLRAQKLVACDDVNKAITDKAKARELKAKAKDFQHSPRREQGQGQTFPRPGHCKPKATAAIMLCLSTLPTRTRQDSFVLSGPSFNEFCLVSIQFPNHVTLRRQVIGLIKWPNFGDWLKNTCFLRCLNYIGFLLLTYWLFTVISTQWRKFDVG